ncbi:alkane 1-monooxygenase [Sulfitobacter sp. AS59]|uniref:alkane 1-monooxygenase n=1 Tax=Sulfitobacter sp. AS59 TaxID=3135784 RepID=UPI00316DECAA
MIWYAIASLTPAVLLALACLFGGVWPLTALLSITLLVFTLDRITRQIPARDTTGRGISLTLAAAHFVLLPLGVWALAGNDLGASDKVLIFLGLGMYFGQVSNSNAHELIHTSNRWTRRIGTAIYCSLLYGHHVSAHLRVHHIHVATDADPNSARLGEGFYAFALRALRGEFTSGLHAETKHRARSAALPIWSHPYVGYVSGAALTLGVAAIIAGWGGVVQMLALAAYAQMQLLLSDYVQHYGLRRKPRADGRMEPVGPQHSWNAPQWYSSAMMLNAPRHSDHHMRPARAFPALEVTPDTMPILPRSLPVMAALALVPPIWRRVMDRRVARWQQTA